MLALAAKKYTLRIPEELHAQLEEQARKERRSLHSQMLVILQEAIDRARKAKGEEPTEDRAKK